MEHLGYNLEDRERADKNITLICNPKPYKMVQYEQWVKRMLAKARRVW